MARVLAYWPVMEEPMLTWQLLHLRSFFKRKYLID